MTTTPARPRTPLPGISSRAWEHPADRGALVALRRMKGYDALVHQLTALVDERATRLELLGSAVRVDERQLPDLHRRLLDACRVLDVNGAPELFVAADPQPHAITLGTGAPVVVVTSALLDLLDAEEVGFVLGRELGHAISGHATHHTVLRRLEALGGTLSGVPGSGLGPRSLTSALQEWSRRSELSADRAGLLATQDPELALRVHLATAGGGRAAELDPDAFLEQGREFLESEDEVRRMLLVESRSHDFPAARAAALRAWVDDGSYASILAGDYPRRGHDAEAGGVEEVREAARRAADDVARAQEAVADLLQGAAGVLGTVKGWLGAR